MKRQIFIRYDNEASADYEKRINDFLNQYENKSNKDLSMFVTDSKCCAIFVVEEPVEKVSAVIGFNQK